jgi:arsenate reductase
MRPQKLLLLGNRHAVRAPMAEAIFRTRVGDAVDLTSAGMEPGPLHPLTLPVLEEAGFALHAHAPVSAKTLLGRSSFNTVILISGPGDRHRPRMFFGAIESQVWEVADPTRAPEAERRDAFRRCRDRLAELVDEWIAQHLELEHAAHDDERTPTRVMRIPKPNLI